MEAWMRALTITLTSIKLKKQFTFGANYAKNKPDLNIDVSLNKYMSSLKDQAVIRIDNLTYNEMTQIIMGEFFDVDIWCGYRNAAVNKIFSGGVFYISNQLNPNKTHTAIIICTSKMVAKFGQSRLNLTLNSGINIYSAINFICGRAGMPNANISTQFKKQFLDEVMNVNDTSTSWLDKLCNSNKTYIQNAVAIVKAVEDPKLNDQLIKNAADSLKSYTKANTYKDNQKKIERRTKRNEAFYKAFRPILEFDLSHLIGKKKKIEIML